jgi:hypothetical protein
MSIEKITAFPEITDVVIENGNIVSLTQGYYDIDKVTVHIQECIEMVCNLPEACTFSSSGSCQTRLHS